LLDRGIQDAKMVTSPGPAAIVPRLQVLGAALLFSTGGAAIKAADFSSWQVAGFRSGVAAAALWLLLPSARRLAPAGRNVMVAVAYATTLTLFVIANKLTTSANAIFLQSTAPLYVLLLSSWALRERLRRSDLLFGLVVAAGMTILLLGDQRRFATAPDPAAGNIAALAAGVAYACLLVGLRWIGKSGGSSMPAAALGNLFAFLAALPMALPVGQHGAGDWAIIGYLGIFQIGASYVLLARAMPHVPAVEGSLLLLLEAALNPIWAWLVHGEDLGTSTLLGGSLILAATVLRTVRRDSPSR
jgi:DME family drug/metabolite transporter